MLGEKKIMLDINLLKIGLDLGLAVLWTACVGFTVYLLYR